MHLPLVLLLSLFQLKCFCLNKLKKKKEACERGKKRNRKKGEQKDNNRIFYLNSTPSTENEIKNKDVVPTAVFMKRTHTDVLCISF